MSLFWMVHSPSRIDWLVGGSEMFRVAYSNSLAVAQPEAVAGDGATPAACLRSTSWNSFISGLAALNQGRLWTPPMNPSSAGSSAKSVRSAETTETKTGL